VEAFLEQKATLLFTRRIRASYAIAGSLIETKSEAGAGTLGFCTEVRGVA
jgi:hypothetical protein